MYFEVIWFLTHILHAFINPFGISIVIRLTGPTAVLWLMQLCIIIIVSNVGAVRYIITPTTRALR